jgi:hypothetical protein
MKYGAENYLLPALLLLVSSIFMPVQADTGKNDDLFAGEQSALNFMSILQPELTNFEKKRYCCEFEGMRYTHYWYELGEREIVISLGVDNIGKLRQIDIRYPKQNNKCIDTPDTKTLSRMLLEHSDPDFSNDYNVNLLGSSGKSVWEGNGTPSSGGAKFGRTSYVFMKMMGVCRVRMTRHSS